MELLCQLDATNTADFFTTFFRLPSSFWRGFLASKLSSGGWYAALVLGCAVGRVQLLFVASTAVKAVAANRQQLPAALC